MFLKLFINSWLLIEEYLPVFVYNLPTKRCFIIFNQLPNKIVQPNRVCVFLTFRDHVLKFKKQMSILLSLLWNDFVWLVFVIFKFFTGSRGRNSWNYLYDELILVLFSHNSLMI